MNANQAVVEVINAELALKGVSVYRLAKDTNISQPTLARALAGKIDITFDRVAVICAALDLPLSSVARAVERQMDGDTKPAKAAVKSSTKKTAPKKAMPPKSEITVPKKKRIPAEAPIVLPVKKKLPPLKKASGDAYLEGIRNRNKKAAR